MPDNFLVDSGAAVSVVHYNLVRDMQLADTPSGAVGANGSPLDVVGQTTVTIILGYFTIKHNFVVVRNLTVDCLLGADFMRNHAAILDCDRNTLSLGREPRVTIPIALKQQPMLCKASCAAHTVRSSQDWEIPARSVKLIVGTIDVPSAANSIMLVEPVDTLPHQLHIARSSSSCHNNQVTIQVLNISPSPITVYKGMSLGKVTPEDDVLLVNDESVGTVTQASFDDIHLPNLSETEKSKILALLSEFSDVFAPVTGPKGCTTVVRHTIPTTSPPIRQPMRRLPEALKETVKTEVQHMLENDIIRPSASPWSSPVVMVRKKDGSWRFCIDYRKLNEVTHQDAYPLPRIDATLDSLAGCQYFTTLDLASGYWQVAVEESDKEKTAFSTMNGHFEFNVMPFGLTNAPATFQRLMECVLAGLTYEQCLIYLDDVIVFSSSFDEHLRRLRNVFNALRKAHLQLKLSKCSFACTEVSYLGHIVSASGITPDPRKVAAVLQFPPPTEAKPLRQFLGLTNYYRKFIHNYASIAEPLHRALKNCKKFQWTASCQQAFEALKLKLTSPPILSYPDFSHPFILHSDASATAIGAVLSQLQSGRETVICYWSRQLTKAERNYSTIEREALAVVGAVKEFYPYLYGFQFTLVTDHNPLTSLKDLKDTGGRLARWMLYLQQFHFTFQHRPGKAHGNADAMSRVPNPVFPVLHQLAANLDTIKAAQAADSTLSDLIKALASGCPPPTNVAPGLRRVFLQDGVLCRSFQSSSSATSHTQVVIPTRLQSTVLQQLHNNSGHLGEQKTVAKVRERYYWPGYEADINKWIQECRECQRRKPPHQAQQAPLDTIQSTFPFEKLSWDIMGPLPQSLSGNRYIVVITDLFSKWVEAFSVKSTDSETLATLLIDEVICRYGVPSYLHSDQGANLTSNLMATLCKRLHIEQTRTSAYHPQGNGQVERFNHTLEAMLATVVNDHQTDWDLHLPRQLFAYRTALHASTGFSPFHIVFGHSPTLPVDAMLGTLPHCQTKNVPAYVCDLHKSLHTAYNTVRSHIQSAHERNKQRYDAAKPFLPYMVGDQVWLHIPAVKPGRSKKFASQWRGPYTVLDKTSKTNYRVRLIGSPAKDLVVHHNRLKLCYGTPQQVSSASQSTHTPLQTFNSQQLYSDVVRSTETSPIGGYTSSSNDSSHEISVPVTTRPRRTCGPPSRYTDFVPP